MRAAVVTTYGEPPRCQEFPLPAPTRPHVVPVQVLAAGLHPRVRSQASGSHYTSTGELPLIPGIDGVGRDPEGTLRYFVLPDTSLGSMAERTLVDLRRSVALPEDCDPVGLAAAMNPAMSSWLALRRRIGFTAGQSVLVHGATGSAGRMAVQIAKLLGAGQVIAAGRNAERLAELETLETLGADEVVRLDGEPAAVSEHLGTAAAEVDVVLDYLWGQPTADALRAVIPRRLDDGQRLSWIQLGSVAGLESPIPSAALRAVRLELVGSGQGSVPTRDILKELPDLAAEIGRGVLTARAVTMPLEDVEAAWSVAATSSDRIVVCP